MPSILMCPPVYYGIEYEINPWMNRAQSSNRALAIEQWTALRKLLEDAGAQIELLLPEPGLPDLVFTANAGLVYQRQVVLSRFKHPERRGETPLDRAWFESAGFACSDPPEGLAFEGAGDALFCGETLFAGYRRRSDARGVQQIAEQLGVEVLPLELVNPSFYHLDTCFCPLAPGEAIYYPAAFDDYGRRVIEATVTKLIKVDAHEAAAFACNAVVVGRRVITNIGCPKLQEELARHGYDSVATPLGEFLKAGGSAKCLTLRLDGEEAAAWRRSGQ